MENKRRLFTFTTLIIVLSLLYTFINYFANFYISPAYAYISNDRRVVDTVDTVETMETVDTVDFDYIEIYNIDKEEVVKKHKSSAEAEALALGILRSITSLYIDITPIPRSGYIIRIPFKTPVELNRYWSETRNINYIDSVYLFFPEDTRRAPYLMILDNNARPIFFNYDLDIKPFLKMLNFNEMDLS